MGIKVAPKPVCDSSRKCTDEAGDSVGAVLLRCLVLPTVSLTERKKTELYHELALQARDLRFQHVMSITTRNNRIIMRMEVRAVLLCSAESWPSSSVCGLKTLQSWGSALPFNPPTQRQADL